MKVTKLSLFLLVVLTCMILSCAYAGTVQPAGTGQLIASAGATWLLPLQPGATGPAKRGILVPALADDQDKDHDGDHDHHHHKDPDPGPAPVPEPASVLLFGAALLAGGTIFRRHFRTLHK